jgi:hypothetical protein
MQYSTGALIIRYFPGSKVAHKALRTRHFLLISRERQPYGQMLWLSAYTHNCSRLPKNPNMIEIRLSVRNGQQRTEIARAREQFGSAKRHACHLALPISLVRAGLR